MQELALAAAREDLSAELKRGDELNHHPVTMARSIAGVARDANASSNNRTVVVAPVAGVLVQPGPEKVGSEGSQIRIGQKLARGQLVASIAQSDRLAILVRLSEVDLPRVHVGNPVYVVGPGFESTNLTGHVASLAGEARPSSDIDAHSTFMARIVLDRLTNTDAQRVRIGMSANVSIILYQTSSAIILPADAILGSPSNAMVKVRSADGVRTLPIRVGHSSSDGIEVVSGLKPGDVVVWDRTPGPQVGNHQ
jgi:multidrug resistance efflux pump